MQSSNETQIFKSQPYKSINELSLVKEHLKLFELNKDLSYYSDKTLNVNDPLILPYMSQLVDRSYEAIGKLNISDQEKFDLVKKNIKNKVNCGKDFAKIFYDLKLGRSKTKTLIWYYIYTLGTLQDFTSEYTVEVCFNTLSKKFLKFVSNNLRRLTPVPYMFKRKQIETIIVEKLKLDRPPSGFPYLDIFQYGSSSLRNKLLDKMPHISGHCVDRVNFKITDEQWIEFALICPHDVGQMPIKYRTKQRLDDFLFYLSENDTDFNYSFLKFLGSFKFGYWNSDKYFELILSDPLFSLMTLREHRPTLNFVLFNCKEELRVKLLAKILNDVTSDNLSTSANLTLSKGQCIQKFVQQLNEWISKEKDLNCNDENIERFNDPYYCMFKKNPEVFDYIARNIRMDTFGQTFNNNINEWYKKQSQDQLLQLLLDNKKYYRACAISEHLEESTIVEHIDKTKKDCTIKELTLSKVGFKFVHLFDKLDIVKEFFNHGSNNKYFESMCKTLPIETIETLCAIDLSLLKNIDDRERLYYGQKQTLFNVNFVINVLKLRLQRIKDKEMTVDLVDCYSVVRKLFTLEIKTEEQLLELYKYVFLTNIDKDKVFWMLGISFEYKFNYVSAEDSKNMGITFCPITLVPSERYLSLSCGHLFSEEGIKKHFDANNNRCPMCRAPHQSEIIVKD
jgi:hypothetical protein